VFLASFSPSTIAGKYKSLKKTCQGQSEINLGGPKRFKRIRDAKKKRLKSLGPRRWARRRSRKIFTTGLGGHEKLLKSELRRRGPLRNKSQLQAFSFV